jgi:hypothetical protein
MIIIIIIPIAIAIAITITIIIMIMIIMIMIIIIIIIIPIAIAIAIIIMIMIMIMPFLTPDRMRHISITLLSSSPSATLNFLPPACIRLQVSQNRCVPGPKALRAAAPWCCFWINFLGMHFAEQLSLSCSHVIYS